MRFLVGESQAQRHKRIREFLVADSTIIAVLLAAADFRMDFASSYLPARNSSGPRTQAGPRVEPEQVQEALATRDAAARVASA